jgi:succinyl-CoA synthetase beta subunit
VPRKKLSEYRAKVIVSQALALPYAGWAVDTAADRGAQLEQVNGDGPFVVKVDQAVKGRFKQGLVLLNVSRENLGQAVDQLHGHGYRWLIIEPVVAHEPGQERYLSLLRDRQGLTLSFSAAGGVDIEAHPETMQQQALTETTDWTALGEQTGFNGSQLQALAGVFDAQYMVFLEINPYIADSQPRLLDLAIEVDDAGEYFADGWQEADFRRPPGTALTPQEETVLALDEKSPASFKLDVINPNGAVFLLLSGGGASIVVADEIYTKGYGEQLANYGEYSGNPNTEETYVYTQAVLRLLLASTAPAKLLFIGGAVANFTDIATTFSGIIRAIDEVAAELAGQHLKVYVRRGGPHQDIGLAKISTVLQKYGLLGAVHDPGTPLTAAVDEALEALAAGTREEA